MKEITNPQLRIIQSNPSSLGTFDDYIVLYDKVDFKNVEIAPWFDENEGIIADELYETAHYNNIFVIHSTSSRGEGINILKKSKDTSIFNRINCDSVLTYHCIAIKTISNFVIIRTGFHEVLVFEGFKMEGFKWNEMNNISNGYQELKVDKNIFFSLYEEQVEVWKTIKKIGDLKNDRKIP